MIDEIARKLEFLGLGKNKIRTMIEIPPSPELGDYSFPTFILAKGKKKAPVDIAKKIANSCQKFKIFEKVKAVGPYVNFYVDRRVLAEKTVKEIIKKNENYGSDRISNRKIMIEYSQPNTHKAFHVGHIRGTSLGESIARICEFMGNKVIRVNYSGDTGMHIAKWLWCYSKYHKNEEIIDNEKWISSIYVDAIKRLAKNEKLQSEVELINKKLDEKSDKKLAALWKKTRKLSVKSWDKIYHELNTKFDKHIFESEVEERGKKIVIDLVKKKIAEVSDGATIINLESDGLGVWVLLRRDGTVLYSAKDLALAEKKIKEYKIDQSLVITDRSQELHFKQLKKTLGLMKMKYSKVYNHKWFGSIRLPWGKMSSRTGNNILYSEFKEKMVNMAADEVEKRYDLESVEIYDRALAIAMSAIKYSILKQDMNKDIIFNPKDSVRFEGDTGPYLLYSYARGQSILRKANYKPKGKVSIKDITDYEKKLVIEMDKFPEIVKTAYENFSPNLIANYSYSLSRTFSEFYHNVPVIGSENEEFKLALVDSFGITLKNALTLLGIVVIPEM